MHKLAIVFTLALATALVGCAGSAFKRALEEDTASAYHRFLREHPRSGYADEARERLDLVRLRTNPTVEAYDRFVADHPDSQLLAEVKPVVEGAFFDAARATGSVEAYRDFLDRFPHGAHRARAEGNAAFLEASGFRGRPAELAAFAEQHPDSDYAAEARRSAAAVATRSRTAIRRVGLRVQIEAGTPGGDRLARVFAERSRRHYEAAGLGLVALRGKDVPAGVDAVLTIRHGERAVKSQLATDGLSQAGILAETGVSLTARGESEPFFSDTISYRTTGTDRRGDKSVLFEAGSSRYWDRFFVPVATWNSGTAVRPPTLLEKPAVAVEAAGRRAVVAYEDGDVQIFDLGDPAEPFLVGEYRRKRDLAKFGGVRLLGQRLVVFGEDGAEIVDFSASGVDGTLALDRGRVGSPIAVESVGGDIVLAGKRGLLLVAGDAEPQQLIDRDVRGLARIGNRLVFTDGKSFFVSTLELLRSQRVEAELDLGRGFAPGRIRVAGRTAVVLGERGIARIDVSNPARPLVRSYIMMNEVGMVRDATLAGGRLFLLGDRGLQLADPTGERVVDSADVDARARISATGRHLVMVGEKTLQVVDATPFLVRAAASPTP